MKLLQIVSLDDQHAAQSAQKPQLGLFQKNTKEARSGTAKKLFCVGKEWLGAGKPVGIFQNVGIGRKGRGQLEREPLPSRSTPPLTRTAPPDPTRNPI